MNGSTGNTASNAPERPERRDTVMSLVTARRMLPLVERVVRDILEQQKTLDRLNPEQDRLDRHRRDLVWLERQRRYQIREEVAVAEQHMRGALDELQGLGLALLDADTGRIGFPTIVNDRKAFFSWQPGEEGIRSWHFVEESTCRPIPAQWLKAGDISLMGKS